MFEPHPKPDAARTASADLQASLLDKTGDRKRVLRIWQTASLSGTGRQVEYMQFGHSGLRPLIWLHSVDYPMAPPWGMCVDASERGFGIVAVRRSGFGGTSPAKTAEEDVSLLMAFLDQAGFENTVLIAEGTARSAGLALARRSPRIAFTLLARPGYFAESFGDIEPSLRDLILQTLQTDAGARLSLAAITQLGRRFGHRWLYENFLKLESDCTFMRNHARDLADAWACLSAIKAVTFRRELNVLAPDPELTEGALAEFAGLAVIGKDTPEVWRKGFEKRSESLGIRTAFLPSGSVFALYQNSAALLDLVETHAA